MYDQKHTELLKLQMAANEKVNDIKSSFSELNDTLFDGFADTAFTSDLKESLNQSMAMKINALCSIIKRLGVVENEINNLVHINN